MPVRPNAKNALLENRIEAIRKAHKDARMTRAELDLSGGIDSAVMAGILVLALGPENVTLVHSRFSTSPAQTDRAQRLAKALGCPLVDVGLGGVWAVLLDVMKVSLQQAGYDLDEIEARIEKDPTILGSIRSTLRAPIGRGFNRLTGGGLRHGTGNECEDRWLRFYQKGGDGEVDSNPIAMLTKGEVYQLAWFMATRIPKAHDVLMDTINATPSPDLWGTGDGHSDEAELLTWTGAPFTYSRIDTATGEYSYVGTIERVSRFLDCKARFTDGREGGAHPGTGISSMEAVLFQSGDEPDWPSLVTGAKRSGYFDKFSRSEVETFLEAARKAERITRHKLNPNIPTYGTREDLLKAGILTNDLYL